MKLIHQFMCAPACSSAWGLTSCIVAWGRRERVGVWSSREALVMKREALLDCLATAQGRYDQAWARTSVDLAIQVPGHTRLPLQCPVTRDV